MLPEKDVAALANELSGETAKQNLEGLARFHRQRGSQGFHAAAELVAERARAYGLSNVQILQFPADGVVFYGTQKARRAWDASEGELSEITAGGEIRVASYAAEPVVLAEDSESADVTADLVDVGDGTKDSEIAFSCHLDHLRPGANDNASGCVTTLEAARTLQKLIQDGKLARPARTLRFLWPPEVEGTVTLLNAKPDLAKRIRAAIHMDMVGGGPGTQAVFHVTRGPLSLPSFVHDVAWAFASWLNTESYQFAAGGPAQYPLLAPEGGKEPLRAEFSAYTMGSDHDVYQDSSFGIPAIYLNDWPDRYIHTNFDTAANIDPTKLKRAAFIGAASGYFLANFSVRDAGGAGLSRAEEAGRLLRRVEALQKGESAAVLDEYERGVSESVRGFLRAAGERSVGERPAGPASKAGSGGPVLRRLPSPRGPLTVFGYDYFADHAKAAGIATPRLLSYEGEWGAGEEYAYEALNFADGTRSLRQITAALSVEYGSVPEEIVTEYLRALQKVGVVEE